MSVHHPQLAQAQAERGWTPTRVTVATALFNSGLSASQVACLIGGVTRNAVIGKIHRTGSSDPARKLPTYSNRLAKGERRRSRRKNGSVKPTRMKDEPEPPKIIDLQIPIEQRRSLAELTDICCHWPVGDPLQNDFFFCGAPKSADDGPYCPSHSRRAHEARTGSRRETGPSKLAAARTSTNFFRPSHLGRHHADRF
jgi:GcrA cell cycle regulator